MEMTMSTKRSTSHASAEENLADALIDLVPLRAAGEHTKQELEVFQIYSRGKAKKDWFEHELLILSQLAKVTVLLMESKEQLDKEGSVIYNTRGTPVCNPLFSVVDSLTRSQLALTRSLNLASSAAQKNEENTKHANTERETKNKLVRTSLLAVPGSITKQ
jgi:hypothetical protein